MRKLMLISFLVVLMIVGWTTTVMAAPSVGDLVINEIMYNPSGTEPNPEWFEVKNVSGTTQDVSGCVISDAASHSHTIANGTSIAAGDYFVFGYSSSIPDVTVDYVYGGSGNVSLNNGAETIQIACNTTIIDSVSYDTSSPWPSSIDGTSISFGIPDGGGTNYASLNDNGNNWKHSTSQIGTSNTDLGTPGTKNDDVLGPTTITLRSLTATPWPAAWPALGLVALGVGVVVRRRRV